MQQSNIPAVNAPTDLTDTRIALVIGTQLVHAPAVAMGNAFGAQGFLAGAVNIRTLGARGDDNDDSAAWAAAVATGKPIFLPPGVYVVSPLVVEQDITVFGWDQTSILKWRPGVDNEGLIKLRTNVLTANFNNMTIDSNRQNHTDGAAYYGAIDATLPSGSRVSSVGVEFINGRVIDIRISGATSGSAPIDFYLENCGFHDGLVGTAGRAAQCVALNDNIHAQMFGNRASLPTTPASYGRAGFVMQAASGSTAAKGDFIAQGNRFKNIGRGTTDTLGCVDCYSGGRNVVVQGNSGENVPGRLVCVKGDQSNVVVDGNAAKNVLFANATAFVMFSNPTIGTAPNRNAIITNNVVEGSAADGFFFDGASAGGSAGRYRNAIISDNIAYNVTARGIYVRNTERISIRNNIIDTAANGVVYHDTPNTIDIDNNEFFNISGDNITGTEVTGGAHADLEVRLSGNKIRNGATRAINTPICKSYVIENNDIRGGTTAITTGGSTGFSRIKGNTVEGATALWGKNGTDTLVRWENDNASTVAMSFGVRSLTIASGVISAYADWHFVDTEAAAATDDLVTINGGVEGQLLTLYAASNTRDVVLKDATGNLQLNGDFTLTHSLDSITLRKISTNWVEVSRSDNAV